MPLLPGTRLGSYEILAPLGAGGMGEVYRARDRKLEREVAIKVLPENLTSDRDALERFEREAKAVAALSHPNILSIHDFETEGGISFAVTELLEGETLRARIERAPIPQRQAIDYGIQIARGLAGAHGRGVIHRDLKPENVFVSSEDHVKILDFGLAKRVPLAAAHADASTESWHTTPGTVVGTIGYISPEQLRGQAVDQRSDIFSFGAILYELLSGRKAFKRDSASDMIVAILREEPPGLTQSGRNISPVLESVVRRCLDKDPQKRFQTAREVALALSEATSGAAPVSEPAKERWLTLGVVAALVVALAVAAVFHFRRPGKAQAPPPAAAVKRVAVLPFENLGAPEDDYFADGISDQVRGKLTSLPGIEVIARMSSTRYRKTDKPPEQVARELDAQYLLTATVRRERGQGVDRVDVNPELVEVKAAGAPASRWQHPFAAPVADVFQLQSDIASRAAEALGVNLAEAQRKQLADKPTQNLAAYDAFLKGEAASGGGIRSDAPSIRKALDLYEQAVALDPRFALAWARIAEQNSIRYFNFSPTPEVAERAREAAEKAVALAPKLPDGYYALGRYYRTVRKDARRSLDEFLKGQKLFPGNSDFPRGVSLADQALGRWQEALENSRKAIRLDPRDVSNIGNLGDVLLRLHRWSEAREAFDRALAISPDNLFLVERKAMSFLGEGDLPAARALLKQAQSRVEPTALVAYVASFQDLGWVLDAEQAALLKRLTPAAFDGDEATWAICLAQACAFSGDSVCVRGFAERALKAFETQLSSSPDDVNLTTGHAIALAYLGRKEDAIHEVENASALWPVAADAQIGPYVRHQLARVVILAGDHEKALDVLEPLLRLPYFLSPGWLKIDPNFDALRGNPRFQKLAAGAEK